MDNNNNDDLINGTPNKGGSEIQLVSLANATTSAATFGGGDTMTQGGNSNFTKSTADSLAG